IRAAGRLSLVRGKRVFEAGREFDHGWFRHEAASCAQRLNTRSRAMTKTTSKMNSSSPGVYPGSDVHDRADERSGAGFVLRDTLDDTKVREVSFAEFLAELKKNGKQAA
ncbi:MAG: hypothetical protein WAJ82_01760, partial [Azonexus sp.]